MLFMRELKAKSQSVNFLAPESEKSLIKTNNNNPIKNKRITLLYFFVGLTIVLVAILGIRALIVVGTGGENGGLLRPKKIGFFDTVKNILFYGDKSLIGEEEDRINILLLGIGGPGHDGPYLSDTNIIVSIKPSTKEVSMVSIPRDLGIKIANYGTQRINYADALGEKLYPGQGGDYARKIFAETFGLEIPYYARVNFNAFEQMIDAVGGIEVDVTQPFSDYSYPGENFSYQTISFASGTQQFNGDLALKFARSRHGTNGENSDFARSRRQQLIISALKDKIMSFGTLTSPTTLHKIWTSLSDNIDTNLDFSQLVYLASIAKDIDSSKIKNLVIDSSPEGYLYSYIAPNGAFMLAPKGGDFSAINQAITNIFQTSFSYVIPRETPLAYEQTNGDSQFGNVLNTTSSALIPTSTFSTTTTQQLAFLENAKIEIQNGTWRAGLASRTQSQLADQGFNIITIGNCIKRPIATTTIYLINQSVSNELLEYLLKQIPARLEMTIPDWLHENYLPDSEDTVEIGAKFNPETDILIILGIDIKE